MSLRANDTDTAVTDQCRWLIAIVPTSAAADADTYADVDADAVAIAIASAIKIFL